MPFPEPILPIALLAAIGAMIVPACLKAIKSHSTTSEKASQNTNVQNHPIGYDDPFSEHYNPDLADQESEPVRVVTKFVEVGSGTEELSFDWIRSTPFSEKQKPNKREADCLPLEEKEMIGRVPSIRD